MSQEANVSLSQLQQECNAFKKIVSTSNNGSINQQAILKMNQIKGTLLNIDSLPPINHNTSNSIEERLIAKEFYEQAAVLSINVNDKDLFQRNIASLKMYYNNATATATVSEMKITVIGLYLLFLLIENRLSDFHCELELLTGTELKHPAIAFCTQLDQHLMVGSYDQVMSAAANPPIPHYHFFLKSLLETVRINITECLAASSTSINVQSATNILMFNSMDETKQYLSAYCPTWVISGDNIQVPLSKALKSEGIPSLKIISQTLTYATELERIV